MFLSKPNPINIKNTLIIIVFIVKIILKKRINE